MNIIEKNNNLILTEGRLELYVLQSYVGRPMAQIVGSTVTAFGALPYRYYKNVNAEKPSEVGTWMMPSLIEFHPVSIDTNRKVQMYPDSVSVSEYAILTFEPGSTICSKYIIKSLDNVQVFIDSLINGQLDNNLPYNLLSQIWVNNILINDINLSVPITVMEMIIAGLCRDAKNMDREFSEVVAKNPDVSMVAYRFGNIRDICAANSVFAALSFEDQNSMIDASLNMTSSGKEQNVSPVEQIIYQ